MHSGSFKYGNYKQQIKRERLKLDTEQSVWGVKLQ